MSICVLPGSRICSVSDGDTILLWSELSGVFDLTLTGHTDYITCFMQLEDGRLCSGSDDTTIKIWNLESGNCEVTLLVILVKWLWQFSCAIVGYAVDPRIKL